MSRDKQTPSTYPEQLKWTSLYILKYGDCVPHKMVGLERMSDYTGVGLQRYHSMSSHE